MNREALFAISATIWWGTYHIEDCVVEKILTILLVHLSISSESKALEGLPPLLRDNAYLGLSLGNTLWPLLYGVVLSTRNNYEGLVWLWSSLGCSLSLAILVWRNQVPIFHKSPQYVIEGIAGCGVFVAIITGIPIYHLFAYMALFYIFINIELLVFPKSFTLGEATFISQSLSFYVLELYYQLFPEAFLLIKRSKSYIFVQISVLFILSCYVLLSPIIAKLRSLSSDQNKQKLTYSLLFYSLFSILIVLVLFPMLSWQLSVNPVTWLYNFITRDQKRISLLLFWGLVLVVGLLPVQLGVFSKYNNNIQRKYFHFLACLLFIPGLYLDKEFLSFSFGAALSLFLILEVLRYGKMYPFGPLVDSLMIKFVNDKDPGSLLLSHMYLLLGCAIPLWLNITYKYPSLIEFTGILSIAIGDSAASIIGINFGKHKWRGSNKSVEGTLAAIVSMMLSLIVFYVMLPNTPVFSNYQWGACLAATTIIALLEAFTFQVDNLFLPFCYWILFLFIYKKQISKL